MAELTAIWLKRSRRGPMEARRRARAVTGQGLDGSADQGGRRQVTLIAAEAWEEVEAALGRPVDPAARRANLMVRGVDLRGSSGRILRVGACRILVRGETLPCERMDQSAAGLRAALEPRWRGGIYGEILTGGDIALGDPVAWDPTAEVS